MGAFARNALHSDGTAVYARAVGEIPAPSFDPLQFASDVVPAQLALARIKEIKLESAHADNLFKFPGSAKMPSQNRPSPYEKPSRLIERFSIFADTLPLPLRTSGGFPLVAIVWLP